MRHIAIVGSGPAGYYTAEAAQKLMGDDVQIDIIDRLPVPYGLIRSGVAPDHQSIKAVAKRYEKTALSANVRFVGNVELGRDLSIAELQALYDAVVLATGAPHDRRLGIAGDDMPGVIGSAAFVGWYNGHPESVALNPPLNARHVVIIGNGNVALDCARILAKSDPEFVGSDIVGDALQQLVVSNIETITVLGRRGPHQIAMTPKELGELGHLMRASPRVDPADLPDLAADAALEPGQRKSVSHLRAFAATPAAVHDGKAIQIIFDFFAMPVAIEGDGKAERLIVERTQIDTMMRASGTGERYTLPCEMVISCIGYQTPPIEGVPFDSAGGRFANIDGRIGESLYCVGWAKRGPSGTIGTNKPDGTLAAAQIADDVPHSTGKPGRAGIDALLASRAVEVVSFRDWKRIEQAEEARARSGAPREKFTSIADMVAALR